MKIGPIKPSPTHTPVSSATSSTFSKIKKSFVKIRNSIKKRFSNWRSSTKESESVNKLKSKINNLLYTGNKGSSSMTNLNALNLKSKEEKSDKNDQLHVTTSFAFIGKCILR